MISMNSKHFSSKFQLKKGREYVKRSMYRTLNYITLNSGCVGSFIRYGLFMNALQRCLTLKFLATHVFYKSDRSNNTIVQLGLIRFYEHILCVESNRTCFKILTGF